MKNIIVSLTIVSSLGYVSLNKTNWNVLTTVKQFRLANDTGNNLYFDFPTGTTQVQSGYKYPTINYLFTAKSPGNLSTTNILNINYRIEVSDQPLFNYDFDGFNNCPNDANTRPFIWAYHNDLTNEYARWWSINSYAYLAAGDYTLQASLDPSQWSSVYGKVGSDYPVEFNNALNNISSIGMTFGGGCFYGHGVNTSNGTARFVLTNYQVN